MKEYNSRDFDFDIFSIYRCCIVHYATAGGDIPKSIFLNPNHSKLRADLKGDRNKLSFKIEVNPNLENILRIKAENQRFNFEEFDRESYLDSFISYAKLGLFSFDRTFINNHDDMRFHLVAYPVIDDKYNVFLERFAESNIKIQDFDRANAIINELVRRNFDEPLRLSLF